MDAVATTGVVFVHGIGEQEACGTLLDWSRPIVSLLTTWRNDDARTLQRGDPVVSSDVDRTGTRLSFISLQIPAYEGHEPQRWLLTEAWWAQATRPPSLSAMTRYMGSAIKPIADGIANGYREQQKAWRERVWQARSYAGQAAGYQHRDLVLSQVPDGRRGWIEWLDWIQMSLSLVALYPICGLIWLVMLPYAQFRRIPVGVLQNSSTLKSLDNFLTGWFGGLPNITRDNVQSAVVRGRLADAIRALRDRGCDHVVVVAHSGGAVVTFETLADDAYSDLVVDKVVTLGEGLDLAWRIEHAKDGLPDSSRLKGDLTDRARMRWVNFWATYDPAPAGPIDTPDCVRAFGHEDRVTVNRMSLIEDHGGYWDNDEDFVIPLLQNLDTPAGTAADSRFFRDDTVATVRSTWRRQRVAWLALWRWVATLEGLAPIALTTVTALLGQAGRHGPSRLGEDAALWWATVPGHELIVTPLNVLLAAPQWPALARQTGEWLLGTALIGLAFLLLARAGVALWSNWDVRERRAAIARTPGRPPRYVPFVQLTLLSVLGALMTVGTVVLLWR